MADIAFYHLQTTSLEAALPQLLAKCLQRDWPVVVECGDAQKVAEIDDQLWTFNDAAFLPHGSSGQHAHMQPIWLCDDQSNPNHAKARFYVAGALPTTQSDFAGYERIVLMFNGKDDDTVASARATWKRLRGANHTLSYWKQSDSGAWEKAGG